MPGDLREIGVVLNRYYPAFAAAMVDYEVETGKALLFDIPPLVRQAASHIADYVDNGQPGQLADAGGCFGQAIHLLRRGLYSDTMKRLVLRLHQAGDEFPAQSSALDGIRERLVCLRDEEMSWTDEALAWTADDWEQRDQRYIGHFEQLDAISTEIEELMLRLRSQLGMALFGGY